MSALIVAYLIFAPRYLINALNLAPAEMPRETGYSGVITLWHIVRFKPESGSVSQWLYKSAKAVEKKHYGIFFEITAMTEEEFTVRQGRGERADLYSFPPETVEAGVLCQLNLMEKERLKPGLDGAGMWDGALRAVPYFLMQGDSAGTTDRVQFIGVALDTVPDKKEYMAEFIRSILMQSVQSELGESLGLYPVAADVEPWEGGDEEYMQNFEALRYPNVPNAFQGRK